METPKNLQTGCSTTLVAALDPSIEGKPSPSTFLTRWHLYSSSRHLPVWSSWKLIRHFSCAGSSGALLADCAIADRPVKDYAKDAGNADKLWSLSEKLVGQAFG